MASPSPKDVREQRRKEVALYIENFGAYGIPTEEIAKKWNCTIQTVYNDISEYLDKLQVDPLAKEVKKLLVGHYKAISICNALMGSRDTELQAKGVSLYTNTQKEYTKFLEDYKLKDKVTDKLILDLTSDKTEQRNQYFEEFEKIKALPEEQQKLIRKVLLGQEVPIDTHTEQPTS